MVMVVNGIVAGLKYRAPKDDAGVTDEILVGAFVSVLGAALGFFKVWAWATEGASISTTILVPHEPWSKL